MGSFRCASCHRWKPRCAHVPNQQFCSSAKCQRERRRLWQARKLAEDLDYRSNEKACCRAWRKAHPGYWRDYRQDHIEAVEHNRERQRVRNAARRGREATAAQQPLGGGPPSGSKVTRIANMDASDEGFPPVISGRYRLIPELELGIANMDASVVVELLVLSGSSGLSTRALPVHPP